MKKLPFCLFLALAASSFAQEVYIRNICDTLTTSATPKVNLRLAYIDETVWYGSSNLSKTDSVKTVRHKNYESVEPFRGQFSYTLPYSVTAGCAESKFNLYAYAEWNPSKGKWTLNDENADYATYIMDINNVKFPGYDATNSYNILAMVKGNFPEDNAYATENLMISKTFEFQFERWFALASYVETVTTESDGQVVTRMSYKYGSSMGMDSASTLNNAIEKLNVPDLIPKINYQLFHTVLMDENKMPADSLLFSSSSAEAKSSSSVAEDASSSSEAKSSSSSKPSSSESTTAIGYRSAAPRVFGEAREVRRLDGSRVNAGAGLEPGIYYVKGANGRWKKQIEMPR